MPSPVLPLLALAALAAAALAGNKGGQSTTSSSTIPDELREVQPDALRAAVADACRKAGRDKAPQLREIASRLEEKGYRRAAAYVRDRAAVLAGGLTAEVETTVDPLVLGEIEQVLAGLGGRRARDLQPDGEPPPPPPRDKTSKTEPDVGQWSDPLAATVAALARRKVGANDTIAAFQRREGLNPDGLYGKRTAAALARYGGPVPPPYIGSAPSKAPSGPTMLDEVVIKASPPVPDDYKRGRG